MRGLTFIVMIFLFCGVVSASFAVKPGFPEGAVEMDPGETKELSFILENKVSEGDMVVEAGIMTGGEIASIVGNGKYELRVEEEGAEAIVRLDVPKDFSAGQYDVRVIFRPVSQDGGQGVQILANIGQKIPVLVLGEEIKEKISSFDEKEAAKESVEQSPVGFLNEKESEGIGNSFIFIGIGIIAIVGVIFYVAGRK